MRDIIRTHASKLLCEIEEISGCRPPDLGIYLHDQFSGRLFEPPCHLPSWTNSSEKIIHLLPDVDWLGKDSGNLFKESHILNVEGASQSIKQFCEELNLESLVYLLCGHEACHHLEIFEENEKYCRLISWIEEGLCFYIPSKVIEKKRKRISELAIETDRILFETLRQPLSEKGHWLYEFFDFDPKYAKAEEEFKGVIDFWDYSASTMAV